MNRKKSSKTELSEAVFCDGYAENFFGKIRYRMLNQNRNWLAIICGETGSGKSYSALTMADIISPRGITIQRNLLWEPKQIFETIKNMKYLKKGDTFIFDEAGVGYSSRDWWSIQNKLLGAVLQTFRALNIGLIFTVPNLSFVDIQGRKLFHNYFETMRIDYNRELAFLQVYNIQHNSRYDRTYYKHPRVFNEDGTLIRINYLAIPKPRRSLVDEYEKIKQEFIVKVNEKALRELEPKPAYYSRDKEHSAIQEIINNPSHFLKAHGRAVYIDGDMVSSVYGVGRDVAARIKKEVELSLHIDNRSPVMRILNSTQKAIQKVDNNPPKSEAGG